MPTYDPAPPRNNIYIIVHGPLTWVVYLLSNRMYRENTNKNGYIQRVVQEARCMYAYIYSETFLSDPSEKRALERPTRLPPTELPKCNKNLLEQRPPPNSLRSPALLNKLTS